LATVVRKIRFARAWMRTQFEGLKKIMAQSSAEHG